MDKLIFPPFEYKTKKVGDKTSIFDIIRKKYIVITPEEIVRQHLIHFLINQMNYPKTLIAVEDGLKVNRLQKRSDVVVYNKMGNIFMVVECKSTKVKLSQSSMDQLSIYNQYYKSEYLALTNGIQLYICKMDYQSKRAQFLDDFPFFQ